jgi:hypothetical protein
LEVDLMHVLHRPHLPRLISVSIAAAVLAIVTSLALASSLSSISQTANGTSMPAHRTAPAVTGALHTNAPGWASNPFANLLSRPLPQPWLSARR